MTAETLDPLKQGRSIHALLDQADVWIDRAHRRHDLTAMSVRYKRNVVGFLERGAATYAFWYGLGEIDSIYGNGRGPSGQMSQDIVERGLDDANEQRTADPVAWLRSTPLVARLLADIEAGRGGTDGDAEHETWKATQEACGNRISGGHAVYEPGCGACVEANSIAPEGTI